MRATHRIVGWSEMLFDYTHSAAASAYSSGGVSADDVTREPQCVSLR